MNKRGGAGQGNHVQDPNLSRTRLGWNLRNPYPVPIPIKPLPNPPLIGVDRGGSLFKPASLLSLHLCKRRPMALCSSNCHVYSCRAHSLKCEIQLRLKWNKVPKPKGETTRYHRCNPHIQMYHKEHHIFLFLFNKETHCVYVLSTFTLKFEVSLELK